MHVDETASPLSRYAVDGYWRHDPEIASVRNEFGHFNNVIKVSML